MASNQTPHPFPTALADDTNYTTLKDISDENTRFVVRQAIADAYALGFREGRYFEDRNRRADMQAARDSEAVSS